ncbi:histidine phosphatase family protein [Oceaniglobus indicus]|uniref:histidine phosphatase family protein n=1 Tax=Oceaniglobus indicus TaxID=2047749 RepID=UPI000C19377A|nr:histidine phosphatase family protein [Oceaniglobus indicus]
MSAIWWWVRHGPTHDRAMCGWRDVPADLSDHAALNRLARFLPGDGLVVSSDLIRARATADAIAGARLRLPPTSALREFDFGAWDGMAFDDIAARDPDLSRAYWETPGDIAAPGGESWNAAAERIAPFVDDINQRHPDRHVIAVAHFGVILSQLARATGRSPYDVLAQKIDNLSVTRLDYAAGAAELINHRP